MRGKADLFWLACFLAGSAVLCAYACSDGWREAADRAVTADVRAVAPDLAATSRDVGTVASHFAPEEGGQEDGESVPTAPPLEAPSPIVSRHPVRPLVDYFPYCDLPPRLVPAV